jgi:hypothetical protein
VAGAQARSRHVAAAADVEAPEALVTDSCPGCGVLLQSADPDAPGCVAHALFARFSRRALTRLPAWRSFYQVPKRIVEPKVEPDEADDELPFTLSAEEEAAQARAAAARSRRHAHAHTSPHARRPQPPLPRARARS